MKYGLFISTDGYEPVEILRSDDAELSLQFNGDKDNTTIEYIHPTGKNVKLEYKKIENEE